MSQAHRAKGRNPLSDDPFSEAERAAVVALDRDVVLLAGMAAAETDESRRSVLKRHALEASLRLTRPQLELHGPLRADWPSPWRECRVSMWQAVELLGGIYRLRWARLMLEHGSPGSAMEWWQRELSAAGSQVRELAEELVEGGRYPPEALEAARLLVEPATS